MSVGAFAASNLEEIKAYLNMGVKIQLNGKAWQAKDQEGKPLYPITYEGSTYLPVRAVGEALGVEIGWDGETETVLIGKAQSSLVKSFDVSKELSSGPMKMKITKVTLDPAYKKMEYSKPVSAVVLAVEVENTSDQKVNWHPTQGKLVLNTKEQIETALIHSDHVDGEFMGKVIKKGNIVFETKSDLAAITNIEYFIAGPFGDDLKSLGAEVSTKIELK
nr:stalk domain-containing protein [Myxococcus sp. CA039A]